MKYLFFTNTPAHVHLYRHTIERLEARGHEVLVLGRDYGCTVDLLEYFELPYEVYGACDTTKSSLVRTVPGQFASIFRRARSCDPDRIFGIGAYAAFAGAVTSTPVVAVLDTEPAPTDHVVSRPFVDLFLTPEAFRKDLGSTHRRFPGVGEVAYLHPDVFEPDPDVRNSLGVDADESFAIVRFNAFGSHHDVGERGFSIDERHRLLDRLAGAYDAVFVADEGDSVDFSSVDARPFEAHPARIHDAIAEAELLVADSQTVVTEAALLGTPAIRSNSFVGDDDMGNFHELEEHGLIFNETDFDDVVDRIDALVAFDGLQAEWERRRDVYLDDVVDLTELLTRIALPNEDGSGGDDADREPTGASGGADGGDATGDAAGSGGEDDRAEISA